MAFAKKAVTVEQMQQLQEATVDQSARVATNTKFNRVDPKNKARWISLGHKISPDCDSDLKLDTIRLTRRVKNILETEERSAIVH